jgi:hypothetical protein
MAISPPLPLPAPVIRRHVIFRWHVACGEPQFPATVAAGGATATVDTTGRLNFASDVAQRTYAL